MKKFTILIAALALVCFSVPAMAVDWNFYGNARMATFYTSEDFDDNLNPAGTDTEDAELQWDLQGNSRIGANIKAENITARFEFGVNESSVSSRRIYGVWNFGAGTLKVLVTIGAAQVQLYPRLLATEVGQALRKPAVGEHQRDL